MLRRDSIKMCRVQGVQQKDLKSNFRVSIRVGDQIFGMKNEKDKTSLYHSWKFLYPL